VTIELQLINIIIIITFISRNSPYYRLLKYLLFLLKHPVFIYKYSKIQTPGNYQKKSHSNQNTAKI